MFKKLKSHFFKTVKTNYIKKPNVITTTKNYIL